MSPDEIYDLLKNKTNNDIAHLILPYIFTNPPFIHELFTETEELREGINILNQHLKKYNNIFLIPKISVYPFPPNGKRTWIIAWHLERQ